MSAGVIAVLASVAVERFGGRTGGALATIPSTVIPTAIGFMKLIQALDS